MKPLILMKHLQNMITRTCRICGKRHFFLAIRQDGFCKSCEMEVLPDLHQRTKRINATIRKANDCGQPQMRIGLIESIIQNAKVLAEYEARGLVFKPSPNSILAKYNLLKDQITVQQIAKDFDKLKQTTGMRSSQASIAAARKLMARISAAKGTPSGQPELARFERRLREFLHSQRNLNTHSVSTKGNSEQDTNSINNPTAGIKSTGLSRGWHRVLRSLGVSRTAFHDMKRSLASINDLKPKESDVAWELLSTIERQESRAEKPDFRLLRIIYHSMAVLACETERPYLEFLSESNRMLLLSYKQRGNINRVQLLTVGMDNCRACQKYDREIMSLEQALKRMPIPCQNCPFKAGENGELSFTCTYVASWQAP